MWKIYRYFCERYSFVSLMRPRRRKCGRQRRRRRRHDFNMYGERTWESDTSPVVIENCEYRQWISVRRPEEPRRASVIYRRLEWRRASLASAVSSMSKKRNFPRKMTNARQVSFLNNLSSIVHNSYIDRNKYNLDKFVLSEMQKYNFFYFWLIYI